MASLNSDIAALQATPPGRTQQLDGRKLQGRLCFAKFRAVLVGAEAQDEWIVLGRLNCKKYSVVPEQSRIRKVSGSAYSFTGKLQKVNAAGTAVDLTTAVAVAHNTTPAAPFVNASNAALTELGATDTLRYLLTAVSDVTAGSSFEFEIAYVDWS